MDHNPAIIGQLPEISAAVVVFGQHIDLTLTAAYGFKVIGLSPTYVLSSLETFPLE